MKSWAQSHTNVGLVVVVLFVALTYLVVSKQNAFSSPSVVTTETPTVEDRQQQLIQRSGETFVRSEAQQIADKQLSQEPIETEKAHKVVCDTESDLSEHCELDGDVRINGTARSVIVVPTRWSERREWKIRAYSRKMANHVERLTVTQLENPAAAAPCTVTHHTPAILFALGGFTGNTFHDNADVLLPLFVASRQFDGEVQFLVTIRHEQGWLGKYKLALQRLSKYEPVQLDGDAHVRCFRHLTVGLHMHKNFGVVPEWAPGHRRLSMPDFTAFLREAYALPRGAAASLAREPERKPRLMLIQRQRCRRFVNLQEIVAAAEVAGFEVVVMDLRRDAAVDEQARVVNTFDAILGVHGAGMTNEVYLPPGGVLIQVVPFGRLDVIASVEYGQPATEMGLRYFSYNVTVEESSLLEMLGPEHPAIKDPGSIHRSGWEKVNDFYLTRQDIRLDIARFAPTLAQAIDHFRQRQ